MPENNQRDAGIGEAFRELVASGAICENCLSLHVTTIDDALNLTAMKRKFGLSLPWCDCCDPCRAFRESLSEFFKERSQ